MILQDTNNNLQILNSVISWAEGWYDREWMVQTEYEKPTPPLRDKITLLRNDNNRLIVVWMIL